MWSTQATSYEIELALTALCCVFIPDCSITKFLNRILGLEVHKQNHLFQYFTDNFDYLIEKDKKEGKYDMGILGTEVKCNSFLDTGLGLTKKAPAINITSYKSIMSIMLSLSTHFLLDWDRFFFFYKEDGS